MTPRQPAAARSSTAHSRLRAEATTIDPWCVELLAYFRTGDASSGPVEATNGEIEAIGRIALSFRNTNNFRTRMLLNTAVARHTPPRQDSGVAALKSSPSPPS